MKLSSPLPVPQQMMASIVAIENVAPQHFLFSLHAPQIAPFAQAGQFVHVLPREPSVPDPFLRRAFSIMNARKEEIDILFRVEGTGTAQIASKRVGEFLDLLGPLGRPFDLSVFHVKQDRDIDALAPILVGGGVGVPPMVMLGKTLKAASHKPLMLLGARRASELLCLEQFDQLQIETKVATDDGSAGITGRVTDLLLAALETGPAAVIYACGPLPMLRAVASVAAQFGVACQVSMEENMPCGIGVCNGCVVAMKNISSEQAQHTGNSDYGRYRRICVEGPAVWANEINWEVV